MLQAMRKSVGSIFVKVILFGLLILSFAIWGVEDMFRIAVGRDPVAQISGEEITQEAFDLRYRRELAQLRANGLDDQTALAIGMPEAILDRMVDESLLGREVSALDLSVSDAAIAEAIRRDPAFQNELGQFDRLRYEQTLSYMGYNEAAFVRLKRGELAQQALLSSMTAEVVLPASLTDTVFGYIGERRRFDVLPVPVDPNQAVAEPEEAALKAYFEENAETYRAPELRAITFVHMSAEAMLSQVSVDDQELRDAYQASIATYTTPEKRVLTQLQFPNEDAAKAGYAALQEGKTPQEAVANGGSVIELGNLTRDQVIDPALAEAAFGAASAGPLPPLQGLFGWVVPVVGAIEAGGTKSFEEVSGEIRVRLLQEKASDALFGLTGAVEDAIGSGSSLESAAQQYGLDVRKVDAVDANGHGADGNPVEGLPPGNKFLQTAFSEESGLESLLEEDGAGGYYILRVESVTPSRLRTYDEVATRLRADWLAEERLAATVAKADALAERARAGADLATLGAEIGQTPLQGAPLTRSERNPGVPLPVLSDAFTMSQGEIRVSETPDGIHLIKLEEILPPDPENAEVLRANLSEQLAAGMEDVMLAEFQAGLRKRYEVTTNPTLARRIADPLSASSSN